MLRISALSRFTRAFALLLKSGVTVSAALPLACESTASPLLEQEGKPCVDRLINGATLSESISAISYADNLLTLSLEAAEHTGTVAKTMEWLSKLYAVELESRIERYTALLEPALMLFTGTLVGILLVATLTPTVKMLEIL